MQRVDISRSAQLCAPNLGDWLAQAHHEVHHVAADAPRGNEPGQTVLRILTVDEIAHATHRDILIDFRAGPPRLVPGASGLPTRIAFGPEDAPFAVAVIAELLRPAGLPAVGDADSARLMRLAARIAASDATVLVQGATGTGKEGIARYLHSFSPRAARDFIAVNCAALPETMMEAMLFGHRKGSFTGAASASDGLFLAADGGTLFLDEIAELPLSLQAKLLRALQEGEILPVGATHPVPVNVRVIAACNRDLAVECEAGRFRSDLYWRLNVMSLELKPLADRRHDILAIAAANLIRMAGAHSVFTWPTSQAVDKMLAHSWPGNARELGNVLQRALVLREGDRIEASDLHINAAAVPIRMHAAAPQILAVAQSMPIPMPVPNFGSGPAITLHDVARMSKIDAIRAALSETDGHRARAARKLGISERTLRYRLAEMRDLAPA
jgi:two-component system response regulator FlrC